MSESVLQNFNHLKIHTQYSICEGAARIDDLQEYSKKNKIKSLGLCDTSNLCGALEFAEKISKSGTQPIIGTQINFKIGETTGLLPFVDMKNNYYLIVKLNKKSRFLMKDAKELLEFLAKIKKIKDINFKYKKRVLLLSGEICSKTKEFLKEWRIL
jgi:DNA polymerase-3 subunit alpha